MPSQGAKNIPKEKLEETVGINTVKRSVQSCKHTISKEIFKEVLEAIVFNYPKNNLLTMKCCDKAEKKVENNCLLSSKQSSIFHRSDYTSIL